MVLIFGLSIVLLALAPTFPLAVLVIAVVAAMAALTDILSMVLLQLALPNELRGRAMGSWVLALGAFPLGSLQIGALASAFGVPISLMVHGLAWWRLPWQLPSCPPGSANSRPS